MLQILLRRTFKGGCPFILQQAFSHDWNHLNHKKSSVADEGAFQSLHTKSLDLIGGYRRLHLKLWWWKLIRQATKVSFSLRMSSSASCSSSQHRGHNPGVVSFTYSPVRFLSVIVFSANTTVINDIKSLKILFEVVCFQIYTLMQGCF